MIADACGSYFLAYSRGPGGERRPIELHLGGLAKDPRIGLLLSTSSARESHEWDLFQAGVFSHEVRSGLYGGADADGDGLVSYREIAAFVARANAKVPNERYRPDVHARAPDRGDVLLDIRKARGRRLEIDGTRSGHYYLEDVRGVRIADVHNAPGQTLSLVRPPPSGTTFLRQVDGEESEYVIPSAGRDGSDVIALADLAAEAPQVAARGAAHESFRALFELPFDETVVDDYPDVPSLDRAGPTPQRKPSGLRRPVGFALLGAGAAALATGTVFSISSAALANDDRGLSHAEAVERNEAIDTQTTIATACLVGGGIAAAAGLVLILWPK